MKKFYRYLSLAAFLSVATSVAAAVPAFMSPYDPWMIETTTPAPEVESIAADEITIKAEGRKVHINGAEDETLEVYNIAGLKIASYPIDAPEKTITLTVPRGVYILRVGNLARKVKILQ